MSSQKKRVFLSLSWEDKNDFLFPGQIERRIEGRWQKLEKRKENEKRHGKPRLLSLTPMRLETCQRGMMIRARTYVFVQRKKAAVSQPVEDRLKYQSLDAGHGYVFLKKISTRAVR